MKKTKKILLALVCYIPSNSTSRLKTAVSLYFELIRKTPDGVCCAFPFYFLHRSAVRYWLMYTVKDVVLFSCV